MKLRLQQEHKIKSEKIQIIRNIADDKLFQINKKEYKLSSNTIKSIEFINDTILIVGTDKGFDLITVPGSISSIKNFDASDGFMDTATSL